MGLWSTCSTLVRARLKYYQTCWAAQRHSGDPPAPSQATSLIFQWDEEKAAYIILPERQQRETSLRYLHSHMHCQRFIVQGFNGALATPPPQPPQCACAPLCSPHAGIHARHPSLGPPPLPVFPSPLRLPSISRPSPFTFHFSASASHSFFSHALPDQTASITSSVTRLIGSGKRKKIQTSKSASLDWKENKSSPLFLGEGEAPRQQVALTPSCRCVFMGRLMLLLSIARRQRRRSDLRQTVIYRTTRACCLWSCAALLACSACLCCAPNTITCALRLKGPDFEDKAEIYSGRQQQLHL